MSPSSEPAPAPNAAPQPRRTASGARVAVRSKDNLVFLAPEEIWAFQALGEATVVHSASGKFEVDAAFDGIAGSFCRPLLAVHPHWLVDVTHVRALEREGVQVTLFVGANPGTEARGIHVPVARERVHMVRDALLANATGLRLRTPARSDDRDDDPG